MVMPEHLLRILLSELSTVRVVCTACAAVVETELAKVDCKAPARCPMCGQDYDPTGQAPQSIQDLAAAVRVARAARSYQVEFVLPQAPSPVN